MMCEKVSEVKKDPLQQVLGLSFPSGIKKYAFLFRYAYVYIQ